MRFQFVFFFQFFFFSTIFCLFLFFPSFLVRSKKKCLVLELNERTLTFLSRVTQIARDPRGMIDYSDVDLSADNDFF